MASALPKDSANASAVSPRDQASESLLNFIRQSANTIHRTELTVAFLAWLVMGLGMIFVFVLVDHWVFPFTGPWRYFAWLLLVGGSVTWLILRIAPLLGRSINPEYAAKRIEQTIPEMKDGLISWLQLSSNESIPRGVLNAVGRYVTKHLKSQDVALAVDQFASMKLAAMLFGMLLIGAIYLAVSPKSGIATVRRLLLPWADIAPSTRVQIMSVTPGDATVTEGSTLPVSIQVRGWLRGDVAQIRYSTDDRRIIDQTVGMNAEIEGVTYTSDFGTTLGGLVQPIHYTIEAGDAKAGPFRIRIQAVPLVVLDRIEYKYPAYMRLAPRVAEADGRIEAPEGTHVSVFARSNQAIKKARIEFDTKPEKEPSFQAAFVDDVSIDDRTILASVLLKLDDAKSNPTRMRYRICSENERGEENVEPVVYPIKVIPDLAPEVQIASEIKDAVDLPVNQKLGIEVRARDPDFGLTRLSLMGNTGNQNFLSQELFHDEQGTLSPVNQTYLFDPTTLRLRAGMIAEVVATASDNRRAIGSDELEPNVRQSRVVRIRITPPSNSPEKNGDKNRPNDSNPTNGNPANAEENKRNQNQNTDKPSKPAQQDQSGNSNAAKDSGKKNDPAKDGKNETPKDSATDDKQNSSPDSKQDGQQKQQGQQGQDGKQDQKSQPQGNQNGSEGGQQQGQAGEQGNASQQEKSSDGQSAAGESGNGQSQAGKNQTGSKQNSQSGENSDGEENGDSSSEGQESSSSPSSNKNSKLNDRSSQRGAPMHDGEAFEELREALGQESAESGESGESDSPGQSSKDETGDGNPKRTATSSDTPTGKGKPSDDDPTHSDSKARDSSESGKSNKPSTSDSNSKDGSSSSSSSSASQSSNDKSNDSGQPSSSEQQRSQSNDAQKGDDQSKASENPTPASTKQDGSPASNSMKGTEKESSKAGPGQDDRQASKDGSNSPSNDASDSANGPSDQGSPSETGSQGKQDGNEGKQEGKEGKQGEQTQGQSGEKSTKGQPSQEQKGKQGQSGEQSGEMGKATESSRKAGKGSQDGKGNLSGKSPSAGDGSVSDSDPNPPTKKDPSAAEIEYARQATDMVLKALERQRDQPDPELLKRMGWSKEQLQSFLDRWKNARDQAENNLQKKREYDESLRSLGLSPNTGKSRHERGQDDRLRGLNEEGSRLLPPESLRERFEAFRKSVTP